MLLRGPASQCWSQSYIWSRACGSFTLTLLFHLFRIPYFAAPRLFQSTQRFGELGSGSSDVAVLHAGDRELAQLNGIFDTCI